MRQNLTTKPPRFQTISFRLFNHYSYRLALLLMFYFVIPQYTSSQTTPFYCGAFSEQDMLDAPWVTVKVNFHFMANNSDNETFFDDANAPVGSGQWVANTLILRANEVLQDIKQNALPGQNGQQAEPIPNESIKIKFELFDGGNGSIFFYENNQSVVSQYGHDVLDVVLEDQTLDSDGNCKATGGFVTLVGQTTLFTLRNVYCAFDNNGLDINTNATLHKTFVHEAFHTFGLDHTHCPDESCPDLDPDQECWSGMGGVNSCNATQCFPSSQGGGGNNIMGNNDAGHGFTPCQLTKIYTHFAVTEFTDFYFSGGCEKTLPPLYLDTGGTIIWDDPKNLLRDVIIETGTNLIIRCSLYMAIDAKIRVRRGARLILEGGSITSICKDEFWGGIVVNGNANKPHEEYMTELDATLLPDDPGVFHGLGGTISRAKIGISTHRCCTSWSEQLAGRGGLIIADGTDFENCRKGVEFREYEQGLNNPNLSSFTDCIFRSDRGYAGVTIYKCDGITFSNCSFEDLGIPQGGSPNDPRDVGILVIRGGIKVENHSRFEGLGVGVEIANSIPFITPYTVNVGIPNTEANSFLNNNHHIRGQFTDNVFVQNNTFYQNSSNFFWGSLSFSKESEFNILQNSFYDATIRISNNQNRDSHINGNYFQLDGSFGYLGLGAIQVYLNNDILTFDRNCFNSTKADIRFNSNESTLMFAQGSQFQPRYNSFSQNHISYTDYWVRAPNDAENYQYFYHPDAETENPSLIPRCATTTMVAGCGSNPLKLEAIEAIQAPDIPSDLPPCLALDGIINPEPPICHTFECLQELRDEWKQKEDLIDGGDTEGLLKAIELEPQAANTLNMLEEASPYLSRKVLMAMIANTSMNVADKADILLKNAPLNASLDLSSAGGLSQQTFNELAEIAEEVPYSEKLLLDVEISHLKHDYYQTFEERIHQLTLIEDYDAIEETLLYDNSPRAQRLLFGLKLVTGNFDLAEDYLNTFPINNKDDKLFKQIQEINLAFLSDEENFELSEAQSAFLYAIAYTSVPHSNFARALLALLKGEVIIPNEVEEASEGQGMLGNSTINETTIAEYEKLELQPNPAKSVVTVTIPKEVTTGQLVIYNINGQLVHQISIIENGNSLTLSLTDFQSGMYFIGINQAGKMKYFEKLMIDH